MSPVWPNLWQSIIIIIIIIIIIAVVTKKRADVGYSIIACSHDYTQSTHYPDLLNLCIIYTALSSNTAHRYAASINFICI